MKHSPQNSLQKLAITILTIAELIFSNSPCFAWDGIDVKKNSTIQIESGNLVREGSTIEFFDSADGDYHTGRVIMMNEVSHATELKIEDFSQNHQERNFLMSE
ncbi:MAG: DUF5334 family protein [Rickettsiales bacterium]|nr:DUF5334 family protein [Rickettsiales bacterium]